MTSIEYKLLGVKEDLQPGEARWLDLGELVGFKDHALVVTASPRTASGSPAVLRVDDINVWLSNGEYHLGCNVLNNGKTIVSSWSIQVGMIGP
jgi:hypothetical protein